MSISASLGLDLAQPGIDRRTNFTWPVTVSKPLTRARLTNFVEIGPLFVIEPAAVEHVVAGFDGARMGFGLEELWWQEMHLRLGIIDDVRARHLSPVGAGYDWRPEWDHSRKMLAARGITERQDPVNLRWHWAWERLRRPTDLG